MRRFWRRVMLFLAGRLVTKEASRDLVDVLFNVLRTGATRTETNLDDQVVEALEKHLDKDALADVLHHWLEARLKD